MERTYEELSYSQNNIIRSQGKLYRLPLIIGSDFYIVEIYLMSDSYMIIESNGEPIRYGKNVGSRVHLGGNYGVQDCNPKFIWNGTKNEWILQTFGYVVFAEIELNFK